PLCRAGGTILPEELQLMMPRLVRMPMMRIREMRVRVTQPCVPMPMGVRRSRRYGLLVQMLMVGIVRMFVFVLERFVYVQVFVAFGDVQCNPQAHQETRNDHRYRPRVAPKQ